MYRLDAAASADAVLDRPLDVLAESGVSLPVTDVVPLDGGLLAVTSGGVSNRIAVFDTRGNRPLDAMELSSEPRNPVAFGEGLLIPCAVGQVVHLDPKTGENLTQPYQPTRLTPGVELHWNPPVVTAPNEVLLSESNAGLFLASIGPQRPGLETLAQATTTEPLVSAVAVAGDGQAGTPKTAYAIDKNGALAAFALPELTRSDVCTLEGTRSWGPHSAGSHVLLADEQQLYCLDATGQIAWQIAWQVALPHGLPIGRPLKHDDGYVLVLPGGAVWRLDAGSGEELGIVDTGRPLKTGPVAFGGGLLVGGSDGSLYRIEQP